MSQHTPADIVARLRAGIAIQLGEEDCPDASVLDDAADEIERLAAVNADLLAALKAILPWHDSHPAEATDNPVINQCRAVIAKATGEGA